MSFKLPPENPYALEDFLSRGEVDEGMFAYTMCLKFCPISILN